MTAALRALDRASCEHAGMDAANAPIAPTITDQWEARLTLEYATRGARTGIVRNEHSGPLVVQKALYPEGPDVCQTVILHPPGGIAGGDNLAIDVTAHDGSIAQLTTPGATKWYKAHGRAAVQAVHLTAHGDALIEWLPLESILFDSANATSTLRVDLAAGATAMGWDIVTFGRAASGERFARGRYRQSIELSRNGGLMWAEYGQVDGADPLLESPAGFSGRTVSGLLWLCAPDRLVDTAIEACREARSRVPPSILCGVTSLPNGVTLARCLADSTEDARHYLTGVWAALRPVYAGREAIPPRLWMT